MKYFWGEIIITHSKFLFWWRPFVFKFTCSLIQANDWEEANKKFQEYAKLAMRDKTGKVKYKAFVLNPL